MAGSDRLFSARPGSFNNGLPCYAFAEQGGRLAMRRSGQGRCGTTAVVGVTGEARLGLDAAFASNLPSFGYGNTL